jgi:hypothetical protein
MKLLHVDSSILGQGSVSRDLSADAVAAFRCRLKVGAAMNEANPNTFFGGEGQGYIDYPTLAS